MTHTADLRRGQIVGDATRRWVELNMLNLPEAAATYAPIASPTFTGDPKAPTAAPGDNDTSIATTAFVHAAVAAGGGITQLTGDVTAGPGSGSQAATLATVMASPGTYNNVTVNAKGLATAGSNVAYLTANQTITLSGDVSGSGTTAITATLPTVNANVGTFQGITVNAKGQVTAAANQSYVTGGPYLPLSGGQLNPGGLLIGTAGTVPSSGALTLNQNTSAPAGGLSAQLQVVSANGGGANIASDVYGTVSPAFIGRFARGTAAAPTAIQSGDSLVTLQGIGCTGPSAYSAVQTDINCTAAENWGGSAQGTAITFLTVPLGTTGTVTSLRLQGNNATFSGAVAGQAVNFNGTLAGAAAPYIGATASNFAAQLGPGNGAFFFYSGTAATLVEFLGTGATLNGSGSWGVISDPRTKTDVAAYGGGLEAILALQPITYRYNGQFGTPEDGEGVTRYGLDAKAVREVMPELVLDHERDGEPVLALDNGPLIYALVNAVKELTARLSVLEARL